MEKLCGAANLALQQFVVSALTLGWLTPRFRGQGAKQRSAPVDRRVAQRVGLRVEIVQLRVTLTPIVERLKQRSIVPADLATGRIPLQLSSGYSFGLFRTSSEAMHDAPTTGLFSVRNPAGSP